VVVDETVKMGLAVASILVILALLCGIIVLVHHRYRLKHTRVSSI